MTTEVLDELSVQHMRTTVKTLASDPFTGRRVGSQGSTLARAWLVEQLQALGVEVAIDSFTATGVRELYRTPSLRWSADGVTYDLLHRREFAEDLASADLPHARQGLLVTDDSASLHGCWVLASTSADWSALLARAADDGAAGVVIARGTDEAGWMPKMIAGRPVAAVPILMVRTDIHAQMIAASVGGAMLTASMPIQSVDVPGANIHADLVSGQSGPTVLLTAHYDGVGDDPDQRHPAAADNASGVAVVLEAARRLKRDPPPGLNLGVALLDAEEVGAHGSAHHAPRLPSGTIVINMDGAAELQGPASVEAGGPAHALLAALDQAGREVGVRLKAGGMASDNRRYAAAGLAAIGIGMGMPGYQTPAETPDRVDSAAMLAAVRLMVTTVRVFASTQPT